MKLYFLEVVYCVVDLKLLIYDPSIVIEAAEHFYCHINRLSR